MHYFFSIIIYIFFFGLKLTVQNKWRLNPFLPAHTPLQKKEEQEKGKSHASNINTEITCLFVIHAASYYHLKVKVAESKNQALNKEHYYNLNYLLNTANTMLGSVFIKL